MARILLVDDESNVLRTVQMLLATEGHDVVPVSESPKAADMIRNSDDFDMLITDIRMSPTDGMQILKLASECWPTKPVVVISAYCSEDAVREAKSLGCQAYVKKPFRCEEILAAVRDNLQGPPSAP